MRICRTLRVVLLLHFLAYAVADDNDNVSSFSASVSSHGSLIDPSIEPDQDVCQKSLEDAFDMDGQEPKVDGIWEAVGKCATHLSAHLGLNLRQQLKDSEGVNKKYLHEIADLYAVLKYLQGPTMLSAFREEHKRFQQKQQEGMDEIQEDLDEMKPYTEYKVHDFTVERDKAAAETAAAVRAKEIYKAAAEAAAREGQARMDKARDKARGRGNLAKRPGMRPSTRPAASQ